MSDALEPTIVDECRASLELLDDDLITALYVAVIRDGETADMTLPDGRQSTIGWSVGAFATITTRSTEPS